MTIGMYSYLCLASLLKILIGFVVEADSFRVCVRKQGVTCSEVRCTYIVNTCTYSTLTASVI
jgi:hypothetical protein